MNILKICKSVQLNNMKQVTNYELIHMIQKRLLQLHHDYVWGRMGDLSRIQHTYIETIPHFILLGNNVSGKLGDVKINLTPTCFDQDISVKIASLHQECNQILNELSIQRKFVSLLQKYLEIGLYFGITPKQIEKEISKRKDITNSLQFELENHYIHKNYIQKSMKMN